MTCLNDAEIQAVADGEATSADAAHAEACAGCASRVAEQRGRVAALTAALGAPPEVPEAMTRRLQETLAQSAASADALDKGATRLRAVPAFRPHWRRPSVFIGLAAAAVV